MLSSVNGTCRPNLCLAHLQRIHRLWFSCPSITRSTFSFFVCGETFYIQPRVPLLSLSLSLPPLCALNSIRCQVPVKITKQNINSSLSVQENTNLVSGFRAEECGANGRLSSHRHSGKLSAFIFSFFSFFPFPPRLKGRILCGERTVIFLMRPIRSQRVKKKLVLISSRFNARKEDANFAKIKITIDEEEGEQERKCY